ncbi:MAG: TetR/AcrR family transcriptional regulator [Bifidobacterium crudilactis]|jgi:AcrR family transcriptional regulator|nr:TetR/AcrR family transcriptional regulator [Bifidobacterium crudilactis]
MNKTALRSQQAVIYALLLKLRTNSFEEITISELASSAGISRKSFYRNFHGKQAVVHAYISDLVEQYLQQAQELKIPNFRELLIHYFTFWFSHSRDLRLLQRNGLLDIALSVQSEKLAEMLPRQPLPWHQKALGDERWIDLLFIGGLWNIFRFHLAHSENATPEHLADGIITALAERAQYVSA